MTEIAGLRFERSNDRVVAGVCGGIAASLGVDPTLVRLVFALLALAGGAGILLYLALWRYAGTNARPIRLLIVAVAAFALVCALGFSAAVAAGVTLILVGLVIVARRGGSIRPGGSLPVAAIAFLMAGTVTLLSNIGANRSFVGPGAIAGALLLVLGPWLWQLALDRGERIRLEERATVAARVHDSVLQTLALIQRHAEDAPRVTSLARRQERELRGWLYGSGVSAATVARALADAAADVEEAHGIRVELATSGDAPLDDALSQIVLAAREAMTNAAKFSGAPEVAVYAEADAERVAIFVRDRGAGFDRGAVPADRRGLTESIEGRMARVGGTSSVVTAPGDGTEVELTLPRTAT